MQHTDARFDLGMGDGVFVDKADGLH